MVSGDYNRYNNTNLYNQNAYYQSAYLQPMQNSARNNQSVFMANNVANSVIAKPANTVQKTIETVQNKIETGVETIVATPNEDKEKKKRRRKAIAAGSAVLVLGGLTMLINPRSSGKLTNRLKTWQNKLDIKMQQSKDSFFKSNFYGTCKKAFGLVEKGGNVYFNFNSGKDVLFQSMCTNSNKKYPEFLTKNKTVHSVVKTVDDCFVKIFEKPHKKITQWFDGISKWTVKNKYKSASKQMDALEMTLKSYRDKIPMNKRSLFDAKLKEITQARQIFSEEELIKRFSKQEDLMKNLEGDLWKNIYNKKDGLMKNPTSFWALENLKPQKTTVEKEGKNFVNKLFGEKDKKGLYDDIYEMVKKNVNADELKSLDDIYASANKKLKKANFSECSEYFDKKRDLVLGGAPTDIVTQIGGLALCGYAVSTADKEDKLQKFVTTGLPVATGLLSSLVFSALLYSGGVSLLAGAAVSGVTSLASYFINKHVFGNKDEEEGNNAKKENDKNIKQNNVTKEVENA